MPRSKAAPRRFFLSHGGDDTVARWRSTVRVVPPNDRTPARHQLRAWLGAKASDHARQFLEVDLCQRAVNG
jgi:hypothetical protein